MVKQYKKQQYRGQEGFGFYLPTQDRLTHNRREGRILSLLKRTSADEVLFHHRFPTSTINVRRACHPFSTKNHFKHNYIMVHNGVINNPTELKTKHEKMGIKYVSQLDDGTFNDSEALLYEIALVLEGKQEAIEATGSIAFIVIERDEAGKLLKLHFARNHGSPLKLFENKNELLLSSEGKGQDIPLNELHTMVYADRKMYVNKFYMQSFDSNWNKLDDYAPHPKGTIADYQAYDSKGRPIDPYYDEDDELAELEREIDNQNIMNAYQQADKAAEEYICNVMSYNKAMFYSQPEFDKFFDKHVNGPGISPNVRAFNAIRELNIVRGLLSLAEKECDEADSGKEPIFETSKLWLLQDLEGYMNDYINNLARKHPKIKLPKILNLTAPKEAIA